MWSLLDIKAGLQNEERSPVIGTVCVIAAGLGAPEVVHGGGLVLASQAPLVALSVAGNVHCMALLQLRDLLLDLLPPAQYHAVPHCLLPPSLLPIAGSSICVGPRNNSTRSTQTQDNSWLGKIAHLDIREVEAQQPLPESQAHANNRMPACVVFEQVSRSGRNLSTYCIQITKLHQRYPDHR